MTNRRNNIDIDVYNGYQAFTTQSFTEANVKNGRQYYVEHEFINIPIAATLNIIFQTGDENVIVKSRLIETNADNTLYEAFVSPTFTEASGTPITVHNFNKISALAPTVSVSHTATISDFDTRFTFHPIYGSETSGSRSSGFFSNEGVERLLDKNTTYSIRVTNRSTIKAVSVFIALTWYEGRLSGFDY